MSRILMLTNIYPIPNVKMIGTTSVCHYFAKEWVKLGHEVIVIYNYTIYAPLLHKIASISEVKIANIFPTAINKNRYTQPFSYELDGVRVYLLPCYKIVPKIAFPKSSIDNSFERTKRYLDDCNFTPDIICAHFLHPGISILSKLSSFYKCKSALILHGEISSKYDIASIKTYSKDIDLWGFRSNPIKRSFINNCFNPQYSFLCFSGVPKNYINKTAYTKHGSTGIHKYIYVGNLIKRKYPVSVVRALLKNGCDFSLNIIGDGDQKRAISKIKKHLVTDKINLLGRVPRDVVSKHMLEAECFIMISKQETFGLVYLEAMGNGCITIASKNEGMDGIIIDGVNGFLCEAGNEQQLSQIITKINRLSIEEKSIIARNAINTAENMIDELMAKHYLNALMS